MDNTLHISTIDALADYTKNKSVWVFVEELVELQTELTEIVMLWSD